MDKQPHAIGMGEVLVYKKKKTLLCFSGGDAVDSNPSLLTLTSHPDGLGKKIVRKL